MGCEFIFQAKYECDICGKKENLKWNVPLDEDPPHKIAYQGGEIRRAGKRGFICRKHKTELKVLVDGVDIEDFNQRVFGDNYE